MSGQRSADSARRAVETVTQMEWIWCGATRTFARELELPGRDIVVDALVAAGALDTYPLRYAVRGDLLAQLGRNQQARAEFTRAAELTGNTSEQTLLRGRAAACADADQDVPGASP
ncbi:hypothetical protein ACW9HJ_23630 [Nocardia gipuzkoensis]